MLQKIFILFILVFLFSGYSFGQTDRSNKVGEEKKEITATNKIDYNKTVNPLPESLNEQETEQRTKELVPLNTVIANSNEGTTDNDAKTEAEIIEKKPVSFNEVINPQPR